MSFVNHVISRYFIFFRKGAGKGDKSDKKGEGEEDGDNDDDFLDVESIPGKSNISSHTPMHTFNAIYTH